ncbi:SIR2 family protein [Paenarthrobacter sp. Z7-10]|uniref:SIR2 family protein n=1 Tax=Paenarthrobacter sp. Z7-10 TaxID=2787635 RepID=UPI0022A91674|nr:SIR2 family protein [Paenarthrobacter sp. Z7-10]MCZ2403525.1 SIR2 family protein [Paenarthrobacter sp. Z7-10]
MWITGDVEIPQPVVDAHADGDLVFFVGAGASMGPPSHQPSFEGLAKAMAEQAGEPFSDKGGLDFFLGSLPDGFDTRRHVRDKILSGPPKFSPTHTAIAQLAATSRKFQVVTTNFDLHLENAATAAGVSPADVWHSPALPIGSDYAGLVYLHGSVQRPPEELIVTDRDFGRAYITEAWATRFLLPMFDKRTVVFVGYSHEDTIMRYLALGLPSNTRRYAFTNDGNDPKWGHLEITAIPYTLRGELDHGNLEDALTTWAKRAKMGALEHDARVQEIIDGESTTLPLPERDYLISQIKTEEGARRFAASATEHRWLRWLEGTDVFTALFHGGPASAPGSVLAQWYATFIENPKTSDLALHTVQRLGRRFSDNLLFSVARATEALFRIDPDRGSRWRVLLMTSIEGRTAPGDPDSALRFGHGGMSNTRAVVRSVLRPYLALERGWLPDDDRNYPPSADLEWTVSPRDLHKIVTEHAKSAATDDPRTLSFFEEALHSAYDLIAAYNGATEHASFRFSRSRIEEQPRHRINHIDSMIDGLRIVGERLIHDVPDLPDRWWSFGRVLFRRLALHLIAEDTSRSADDKIAWLTDRQAIFLSGAKHEVFRALADTVAAASAAQRVAVLEEVRRGPQFPAGVEDVERHIAYSKFNVLVWLTRAAPEWAEAETELAAIRAEYSNFAERDAPDQDFTVSTGTWGGVLPMEPDDFIATVAADGAEVALSSVMARDYSERNYNEPTWDDALDLFGRVAREDPASGLQVLEALHALDDEKQGQIRNAIISGWAEAVMDEAMRVSIIDALSQDVVLAGSPRPVAQFLLGQVRQIVDSGASASADRLRNLARDLLARNRDDEDAFPTGYDGPMLALNSWPGELTAYWLTEIDRHWRSDRDGWGGLNDDEGTALHTLLTLPNLVAATAPAIANQLFFLFAADEAFTTDNVIPLFTDSTAMVGVWKAYLYGARINDRMLKNGMFAALLSMWDRLSDLDDEALGRQFLSLAASIAAYAGISTAERSQLCFRSVTAEGGAHAPRFAEEIGQDLTSGSEDGETAWDTWLRDHLEDRLNGVPREPEATELAAWADVVPLLGARVPDGITTFHGRAPGMDADSPSIDIPREALDAHRSTLVAFLAERVTNSEPNNMMLAHQVHDLVDRLAETLTRDELAPLVTAARAKGYLRSED